MMRILKFLVMLKFTFAATNMCGYNGKSLTVKQRQHYHKLVTDVSVIQGKDFDIAKDVTNIIITDDDKIHIGKLYFI